MKEDLFWKFSDPKLAEQIKKAKADQGLAEQKLEEDNCLNKKPETNQVFTKQKKAVLDQNTQESKPKEENQEEELAELKLEEQSEEKEKMNLGKEKKS